MKPVLFLAFLAIGPALAQQSPVTPAPHQPEVITTVSSVQPGDASPAAPRDGERDWLCGR